MKWMRWKKQRNQSYRKYRSNVEQWSEEGSACSKHPAPAPAPSPSNDQMEAKLLANNVQDQLNNVIGRESEGLKLLLLLLLWNRSQ